jgi:hypothetical protein
MSRYSFAYASFAPLIVKTILLDDTNELAFPGDKPAQKIVKEATNSEEFMQRLQDDELNDDDMAQFVAPLFKAFAHTVDPTANSKSSAYKYLFWAANAYHQTITSGRPILAEDLFKIKSTLKDFEAFQKFLPTNQRQINAIQSYDEMQNILRIHQQSRDAKKAERVKLSDDIRAETTVVYEGPEGRVVIPHTWNAAKFWGMQTKWCISMEDTDEHFERYNKEGSIYIYLPKPSHFERERMPHHSSFKFAVAGDKLYDEHDYERTRAIPCLHSLVEATTKALSAAPQTQTISHQEVEDMLTGFLAQIEKPKKLEENIKHALENVLDAPGSYGHFRKHGKNKNMSPLLPAGKSAWPSWDAYKQDMNRKNSSALSFAFTPQNIYTDKNKAKEAIALMRNTYFSLPADFQKDEDIILAALERKIDPYDIMKIMNIAGEAAYRNRKIIYKAIEVHMEKSEGDGILNSRRLSALPLIIQFACDDIKNDVQLVRHALNASTLAFWPKVLNAAGPQAKQNSKLLMEAFRAAGTKSSDSSYGILSTKDQNTKAQDEIMKIAKENLKSSFLFNLKARVHFDKLLSGKPVAGTTNVPCPQ